MVIYIDNLGEAVEIIRIAKALNDPSDELLEALAARTGTSFPPTAYARLLRELVKATGLLAPKKAIQGAPSMQIHVNDEGPYKGTKPDAFVLGQWKCGVDSWRELVRRSCSLAYLEYPAFFRYLLANCGWSGRKYIGTNADGMKRPAKFSSDGLFVETNLSANNAANLFKWLADAFGYENAKIIIQ